MIHLFSLPFEIGFTINWAAFDRSAFLTAIAILLLLICSGFFSGSETSLTTASKGRLHSLAKKGSRGAKRALKLKSNSEKLIGGILLGNNLVNILATALATKLFTQLFGDNGVVLATFVMTLLVLIFAEVLPKTLALLYAERMATFVSRPIAAIVNLLGVFVLAVNIVVSAILKFLKLDQQNKDDAEEAQAEIEGAITLAGAEGAVEKDARDILLSALDLKKRTVDEVMLHRSGIEMIDASLSPRKILSQCLNSRYTRLPIYKDNPENIIGVVHAKELLKLIDKLTIKHKRLPDVTIRDIINIAMKPYFVPETTPLDDQMREFLKRRTHFAFVVDEYGALQGLITLEDILEEIVGEIADEHDDDAGAEAQKPDSEGFYLIKGSETLRDLNRTFDWNLPTHSANTIAGLVIHEAEIIPEEGQSFNFFEFRFIITKKDRNRIAELKIKPLI